MKKIFTLIAMALVAVGANAQTYNFSDTDPWGDNREITADFTVGPITLKAGAGQDSNNKNNESFTLDGSNKTIGEIKCTRRWKTGGMTNTNGTRSIAVTLAKNKTISVAAGSSNSEQTRTLLFATEPGNDPEAATVLKSYVDAVTGTPAVFSYNHTGDEATIYICCKGGGTNYYFIKIEDYVDPSSATAKTWDFSAYTDQVSLHGDGTTVPSLQYDGLTLVGVKTAAGSDGLKDYVSATAGFHGNGASDANSRYISYKPAADGTLKATFKSNKAEDAANRTTAIGTSITKSATAETAGVLAIANAETGIVEANVTAGTTYYIWFAVGGQAITKVEYTPGGTSGVQTVKAAAVQNGAIYNLAGQKVSENYKGVVIKNGQKVVIK